jgi:acyl carrier protein
MTTDDFLKNFVAQLEETDANIVTIRTKFRDLEEWSSLSALAIMAMVDEEYDVILKGDDIQNCQTIEDIYIIVKSRI